MDDFVAIEIENQTAPPPFEISSPRAQTLPFVFASPHSGRFYPRHFVSASRLDPIMLRRSEDSFVDELFGAAPDAGAPLIMAQFPRAYVDPNREAFELDPRMFKDKLPEFVNTKSARVFAGLGTVARVVTNGEEIYRRKLTFAEARERIDQIYFPYHQALTELIDQTRVAFGSCTLIDCHSMPSVGGPMDEDRGNHRVEFVLGDNHGAACPPPLTDHVEQFLTGAGYRVRRNNPYSGGYTTRHYGRPAAGVNALQIEINRDLYMNEMTMQPTQGFSKLQRDLTRLIDSFHRLSAS